MKLAFLENINFSSVLKRFPLPILVSSLIGILSILLIEELVERDTETFRLVVKCLHILILLFAAFALLSIARLNNAAIRSKFWIYVSASLFLALIYFFLLPKYPVERHAVQTIGLFLVMHLLITVLPYWINKDLVQYWAYNKTLLLRFLEASIYTVFIFVSLSVAIVALEKLFGISFKPLEIYGDLWVVLISLFHPLYFFSRFPDDLVFDNHELENSLAFRVFTRRILLPIVLLYGIILLAYVLKIIFQWSWPRGWVSNMILWFSVFGILAYLLNYIKLEEKEGRFVLLFKKYYFHFQALMSIVLMLAVYKRIGDYGVTEPRYIVASLGLWLFLISCYFVVSDKDNIKWIPTSLAVFVLIATVGPFTMHRATAASQFGRAENLFKKAGMLNDGVLQTANNLSSEMERELSNILWILGRRDLLGKLKQFEGADGLLPQDSLEETRSISPLHYNPQSVYTNDKLEAYAKALNIPYSSNFRSNLAVSRFNLFSKNATGSDIRGFDQLFQFNAYYKGVGQNGHRIYIGDDQTSFEFVDDLGVKHIISLNSLFEKYKSFNNRQEPLDSIVFESNTSGLHFKFLIRNINGRIENEEYKVENVEGIVLLKALEKSN